MKLEAEYDRLHTLPNLVYGEELRQLASALKLRQLHLDIMR